MSDTDLSFNGDGPQPLIVIASNRGPYQFTEEEDGSFTTRRGSGGLVTALAALAEKLDVLWIAAGLSPGDRAWAQAHNHSVQNVQGINLRLLLPDEAAYQQYYNIIANPMLWFIQHQLWDSPRKPVIDAAFWQAWREGYVAINRQFAETIAESVRQTLNGQERPVIIFPQDYHLYLVPHYLRELLGESVQIQPFLHIPWPGPDAWRILPEEMRDTLIRSMLASDRIGFQTRRDAFNFVQTARFYVDEAHSHGSRDSVVYRGRRVSAHTYPISVDVEKLDVLARDPQTELHKGHLAGAIADRKLILRIDRIEPSKNILRGLQAYQSLLEMYPEHHNRVQMVSLLVPSRMEVDEYQDYLRDIMAESGMINAHFSDGAWEPSRVIVGENYPRALAAMQICDVLLVNPIADGMNLVAKEGAVVNNRDGVLVLSEHAGVFYELGEHALCVSPFDVYGTAEAMHKALVMPADERQRRARAMDRAVRANDVRRWFHNQVADALQALQEDTTDASG